MADLSVFELVETTAVYLATGPAGAASAGVAQSNDGARFWTCLSPPLLNKRKYRLILASTSAPRTSNPSERLTRLPVLHQDLYRIDEQHTDTHGVHA